MIEDIAGQIEAGEGRIIGVMVESHLLAGRQDLRAGRALVYGQSITDGCIGWDSSVQVLERLAQAVRRRRSLAMNSVDAQARPRFRPPVRARNADRIGAIMRDEG